MQESIKRERFIRVAENRTQNILDAIVSLGNCANPTLYEYGEEDVEKVFSAIERSIEEAKGRFAGRKRFSLNKHF